MRYRRPLATIACLAPLLLALVPARAGAVTVLLSRWNQSQIHTWNSANPNASVLLHTNQCNDADYNAGEGSTHGWFAEHFNDYFARFVVGSNNGFQSQYTLGQGGRTHYDYPKHVTVYNGEVIVTSRNDGKLWRYSNAGVQNTSIQTSQTIAQGTATDGADLYVSLWNGQASVFARYNAAFVLQQSYTNPTGLGNFNNIVDFVYDPATAHFFGIATTGEGGTNTNSSTVVEFTMGGAVTATYNLPFAVDGIGNFISAVCGDGNLAMGEACDDGNMSNTDACTNACKLAACGDGFVQAGVEGCDDGNMVDEDACTNACEPAACGDGIVQAGVEACDDGNDVDEDACTAACEPAACGDGFVQMGEGCDDGNDVDDDACSNACVAAACGDGVVQMGEGCDDGNDVDDDACSNACVAAACGDGVVQVGEGCDDGNDVDDDECSNACVLASCGDGIVQPGEGCDDGNAVDDDECTNACMLPACGDGIQQSGEECDDAIDDDCVDCVIPILPETSTTGDDTTGAPDPTTGDVPTTGAPGESSGDSGEGSGGNTGGNSGTTGDLPTSDGSGGAESSGEASGSSGTDSSGASVDDGCGCATSGPGGGLWALLALVGLRRRRR